MHIFITFVYFSIYLSWANEPLVQTNSDRNSILDRIEAVGDETLSVEKLRVVIPGLLYRGGSGTIGPLRADQIHELVNGFGISSAVYLYDEGLEQMPSVPGFDYSFSSPQGDGLIEILTDLQSNLLGGDSTFVHCWGGNHFAGLVAAAALYYFCEDQGYTKEVAREYWELTNRTGGYESTGNRLCSLGRPAGFQPMPVEWQVQYCPRLPEELTAVSEDCRREATEE